MSDVIGVDLSLKQAQVCVLDEAGEVQEEAQVRMTRHGLTRWFSRRPRALVVMETGGSSPWVSRLVEELGHEVLVANPRRVRLIAESSLKNDRIDAEILARLGRLDPQLLHPVKHRSEETQRGRSVLRVRASLVEQRKACINTVRGLLRGFGHRVQTGSAERFLARFEKSQIPIELKGIVAPLLTVIGQLDEQLVEMDVRLEELSDQLPITKHLQSIDGVGKIVSLAFVLCIEDPERFDRPRDVGPYLGLRPRLYKSGDVEHRGRISKEGDGEMRRLLVQAAHALLRTRRDSDLKRWAERLAARSGRKKAVVGLARKIAVLMVHLWQAGEVYEPLRQQPPVGATTQEAALEPLVSTCSCTA